MRGVFTRAWWGVFWLAAVLPGGLRAEDAVYQKVREALLVVTQREGAGSGFVAKLDDVPVLMTNAHVIASASKPDMKLLSGNPVPPGKGRLAVGHDVAVFEAPAGLAALGICPDVGKEVSIGDEVVIYGNSHGASVVTEIKGKVTGIGPDVVEVDAPFVPGNSGSPILHVKSGKVIGIASYLKTRPLDEISKDSGLPEVRRFGYRLDTIKQWQDLNWPIFQNEAAIVHNIEAFSEAFFLLQEGIMKTQGRVELLSSPNPRIQRLLRNLQADVRNNKSEKGFQKAVTSFLWALQSEAKQEFLPGKPVPRYWFTNMEWNRQKELREDISKRLGESVSERKAAFH